MLRVSRDLYERGMSTRQDALHHIRLEYLIEVHMAPYVVLFVPHQALGIPGTHLHFDTPTHGVK
jgi:hypothetical protein